MAIMNDRWALKTTKHGFIDDLIKIKADTGMVEMAILGEDGVSLTLRIPTEEVVKLTKKLEAACAAAVLMAKAEEKSAP
jgi:hypothetical protein